MIVTIKVIVLFTCQGQEDDPIVDVLVEEIPDEVLEGALDELEDEDGGAANNVRIGLAALTGVILAGAGLLAR